MESKFISDQTLGYSKAQNKIQTTDRVDELETKVIEVVQFLSDYEKYQDEQLQNLATQIELVNVKSVSDTLFTSKSRSIESLLVTQVAELNRKIRITLNIAVISAFFSIGMGVALWLIK